MNGFSSYSFFDGKTPFQSLIQFTNNGDFLSPSERKRFYLDFQEFFSRQAFKDYRNESNSLARLNDIDLPKQFSEWKKDGVKDCESVYLQLVACIAKATGFFFSVNSAGDSVYQVYIPHESSGSLEFYWGWLPKRYVDVSDELQKSLDSGKGIVSLSSDVHPSVLVALQRFHFAGKSSVDVDMSLESLLLLYRFAKDKKIPPLQTELLDLFKQIRMSEEDKVELKELLEEYKMDGDSACKNAFLSTWNASRSLVRYNEDEGQGRSEWFEEHIPYFSIRRFTARCCSLSPKELPMFLTTVGAFFRRAAFHGHVIEIDSSIKKEFVHICIPFMLETLQASSSTERNRFIASIAKTTGLALLQLNRRNQLHLVLNTYGDPKDPHNVQTTWIPAHVKAQSKLLPDRELQVNIDSQAPIPGLALDIDEELIYESPKQLVNFLCVAVEHEIAFEVAKICRALIAAAQTRSRWAKCSKLLIPALGKEKVCQALKANNVPPLKIDEDDLKVLDSTLLWNLFAFEVGSMLENIETVKERFGKLNKDQQVLAVQEMKPLALISKDPFKLDEPTAKTLVDRLCLALDLSLDQFVKKAKEKIQETLYLNDKYLWISLSNALARKLHREDIRNCIKDISLLKPDYALLTDDELCVLFLLLTGDNTSKERFDALSREDKINAARYARQLALKEYLSQEPGVLVEILWLALQLSLDTCVEKTCIAICNLRGTKWEEMSTALALKLWKEGVAQVLQKKGIPMLQPNIATLKRDYLKVFYDAFTYNMQLTVRGNIEISVVIEKTFGSVHEFIPHDFIPDVLNRYKTEAAPAPLDLHAINVHLASFAATIITKGLQSPLKECTFAIVGQLATSKVPLTREFVADCVRKNAAPYRQSGLEKGIYNVLNSAPTRNYLEECGFAHLLVLLQDAYQNAFTATCFEDIFDSGENRKVIKPFTNLASHLKQNPSLSKDSISNLRDKPYFSDEEKLKIGELWLEKGASILYEGYLLNKTEIWDALCLVYQVDAYILKDHIEKKFVGDPSIKTIFIELMENCKLDFYIPKYASTYIQQAMEKNTITLEHVKEVLKCIGDSSLEQVLSVRLKGILTTVAAGMLAYAMRENNTWAWGSQVLNIMERVQPPHEEDKQFMEHRNSYRIDLDEADKVKKALSTSLDKFYSYADWLKQLSARLLSFIDRWMQQEQGIREVLKKVEVDCKADNSDGARMLIQIMKCSDVKGVLFWDTLRNNDHEFLKRILSKMLGDGTAATQPFKDYLNAIIAASDLIIEFYDSAEIWQPVFSKILSRYSRPDFSILEPQHLERLGSFFSKALREDENDVRMPLFRKVWDRLCQDDCRLDLFVLKNRIKDHFQDSNPLAAMIPKLLDKTISEEEANAMGENDVKALEEFFEKFIKNEALFSKSMKSRMEDFLDKQGKRVLIERIGSQFNDHPKLKAALLSLDSYNRNVIQSHPLTKEEARQAAQLWLSLADGPEAMKLHGRKYWDSFCGRYQADTLLIEDKIDAHFQEKPKCAAYLKETIESCLYSAYELDMTQIKRKIALAMRTHQIGAEESSLIRQFLQQTALAVPYVSKPLEQLSKQMISEMGNYQEVLPKCHRAIDLFLGDALQDQPDARVVLEQSWKGRYCK